jgi:AcrR family transcriptional regulator
VPPVSKGREYRSSLREEQAQQTRTRIRKAARKLFGQRGFATTTISDIARAARVSPATIYAIYESKAGIVSAILEEMEENAEIGPQLQAMFTESDPRRQLRLFVAAHCALYEGGTDVLRSAMQAVENPEVAVLAERGDTRRRSTIDELVRRWHEAGALRTGIGREDAAERMWLLTTVDSFLTAVDRLGWSPDRYQKWVGDLLETEIIGPERS